MMPISGPTVALAITMLVGMGLWTIDYKRDAGFELTMCVAQSSAAPRLRALPCPAEAPPLEAPPRPTLDRAGQG